MIKAHCPTCHCLSLPASDPYRIDEFAKKFLKPQENGQARTHQAYSQYAHWIQITLSQPLLAGQTRFTRTLRRLGYPLIRKAPGHLIIGHNLS